jgi:nucleoside-diphosphate-sugar epimerase
LTDKNVDSPDNIKKALITGISGFTGKFVEENLTALGFQVHGLSLESTYSGVNSVASLLDPEELEGLVSSVQPSVVIHLAAISSVVHGDVAELYAVNITGTRNLLQALKNVNCGKGAVILASSANVYGNGSPEPITETEALAPENDYAVSKLAMEKMANLWGDTLPITITRPFNYTGRGQSTRFLIPKIVDHFKRREKVIELGNIDVYRDFSDVRSVAWSYGQLAVNPAPGEIFNISSGTGTSILQVISYLEELTGHQMELSVNPKFVREHEVRTLTGDSSKLWKHIGHPDQISIRETLKWMLDD